MNRNNLIKNLTKKLWRKNKLQPLGSIAISVYFYLLWEIKKQNNETILVSDSELATQLKLRRNTVRHCRENLKKSGLLDFKVSPGKPVQYLFDLAGNASIQFDLNTAEESVKVPDLSNEKKSPDAEKQPIDLPNQPQIFYPDFSEILSYAQTLKEYNVELEIALFDKYQSWVSNGWKNAFGKPITNWQQSVKNSLPYLVKNPPNRTEFQNIPEIKRP